MVDEDFEKALTHYSSAIDIEPTNADGYSKRAAAQLKRSRFTEAVSDATASIRIEPTPMAYMRKGLACFSLHEYESARAAFDKAIELGADGRETKRWVRKCNAEIHLEAAGGASSAVPAPTLPSSSAESIVDPSKIRHEWYQTQTHVVVSILARQVPEDNVSVKFGASSVEVSIAMEGGGVYKLNLSLYHQLDLAACKYEVKKPKVELTLKKQVAGKWDALEGSGSGELSQIAAVPEAAVDEGPRKAVYSGSKKNWDQIDSDLKKAEEEEKPEGEEALNKLFRDIYGKASDETRRAMNKSFQTSGGTVLSTNWEEVAKKDYEKDRTAPEGQEWKKWG